MKKAQAATAQFEGQSLVMDIPTAAGVQRFDILDEMSWGIADDSQTLEDHAGKETWWAAVYADQMALESRWKETVYEPFMAHLRRFAIHFLAGQGLKREKMTQRDIDDARLRLFTRHATQEQRATLTATAFRGYMLEKHESAAVVKEMFAKHNEMYAREYAAFIADMYCYQKTEDPVWVEDAIDWRIDMERATALLGAVAKAFGGRGYLLRQAAENEKARKLNMGMTYEDLVAKIMPLIKQQINPLDTIVRDR